MSPITLDDKALRGLRDIIRQEVQAAMGAIVWARVPRALVARMHTWGGV